MPTRARIALLALLIAGAVIAVRAPGPQDAEPGAKPPRGGDPDEAFGWLMLLAVPGIALLIYAVLRYTPLRRPLRFGPRDGQPLSWRRGLIALVALLLISVGLGLLGRLVIPERLPRPRRGSGPGAEPPQPGGKPPSEVPPGDGLNVELWSTVLAVLLLALFAAAVIAQRRQRPAPPPPEDDEPAGPPPEPPLAVAVRRALSTVDDPGGDPRAAIIRCYAAMEQALAEAPVTAPQPADTPSDVLRRATEAGQLHGDSGPRLVNLFAEARYSPHAITEDDRATAASTLRAILQQLRGPAWTRS